MKKIAILVLIIMIFTGAFTVAAQSIDTILETVVGGMEADFGLLLDGLSSDIDTVLLQNAISGQNIGMAELGSKKFSTFYAGLPAINLTAANGFLTFRNEADYFEVLDLNSMLNGLALDSLYSAVGVDNAQYVDLLLNQAFPIPAVKFNLGFKLPGNLELLLNGFGIPTAVLDLVSQQGVELPAGLNFNYLNVGGVLRYVLLRDSKETPGFSIGLGGYYNDLSLGIELGDLLSGMLPAEAGDVNPFADASMSIGTRTLAFGIDVAMSKRLLAIFIPYFKIGAWYAVTDTGGNVTLTADSELASSTGHSDLDLLLDTGMDILLGPFGFNLGADYNLGSGVWGVNLGSRLQL